MLKSFTILKRNGAHLGGITIKGAKGLVDNQFFMYHVYFDNVSHITFK
jgi:hypothetical protein